MSWDKESILDLAAENDGGVLVALAGEARVYRVTGREQWELLFDLAEQQALTLATHSGHLAFIGTGNVGRGYRIEPNRAGRPFSHGVGQPGVARWPRCARHDA